MNKILKLATLPAVLLCTMACEDIRETNMVDDGILLSTAKYSDNLATVSVYDGTFSFNVFKSGKGTQSAEVEIALPDTLVTWYNEQHGTHYVALPENTYSISATEFSFRENAVTKQVKLFWDPKTVSDAIAPGEEAVIPVKIAGSNLEVFDGTDYMLVKFTRPSIKLTAENKSRRASLNTTYKDVQSFSVSIDTRVEQDAIISFIMDPELVPAYNAEHETEYLAASNRMIELPMKAVIAANSTSVNVDYTIYSEQFYNSFKEEGLSPSTVVAPIRILSAQVGGIDVPFTEDPFYVTVEPAVIPGVGFKSTGCNWPAFVGANGTDVIDAELAYSEALTGLDSYIGLTVDESLVAEWNAANGKNYAAPGAGLISVPEKVFMPADNINVKFNCSLNRTALAEMGEFDGIVIPLVPTSLIVNEVGNTIEADPFYIVLTKPERGVIMGPWPVLEGANGQSIGNGDTVDGKDGSWYAAQYTVAGLCDGETAINEAFPNGSVWGAWFDTPMELPLVFVFDMGIPHKPDKIFKHEFSSFQGSWNHIQIYLSDTYGDSVDWKLAFDGEVGPSGWEDSKGKEHSMDMPGDVIGRYLKIVLVEPTPTYYANTTSHMAGYIREIWFEGL